ncbi:MAG: heme biosynthesis HemY N-terminal domain-containing protein [Rhizobiaceae bacterium]
MIRILSYVILIFVLAAGFAWLADRPGELSVTWQGMQYQVTLLVAVTAIVALIVLVMLLWWLLRTLVQSPDLIRRHFRARKRDRGYQSLSTGIIAAGAGDGAAARRMAKQAGKLLSADQEPLIKLLDAQATLLEGRTDAARKLFEAMVDDPETRLIGLRGLFLEAERLGDVAAARHFANRAAEAAPQLGWAGKVAMENRIANGDYDGAIGLLDQQKSAKSISKDEDRRRRAVLLTGKAMSLLADDAQAARAAAAEANRLAPELVPAAATLAEALNKLNDPRKALRTIEYTYKINPHPELAALYVAGRGGDKPEERLRRAKALAAFAPGHPESDIAIARAALAAGQLGEARKHAEAALNSSPRESIHLILADIEQADSRSQGKVRAHLARALRAPRDPAWTADGMVSERWMPISPVSGRIDAFEWKVPVERLQPVLEFSQESEPEELPAPVAPVAVEAAEAATLKTDAVETVAAAPVRLPGTTEIAVTDTLPMIPDDPGVKQRADGEPQPKRFRLF